MNYNKGANERAFKVEGNVSKRVKIKKNNCIKTKMPDSTNNDKGKEAVLVRYF